MKVAFCLVFLDFFLLVTHVYAARLQIDDQSSISTALLDTGTTDYANLETTETLPMTEEADPCPSLEAPVVHTYTNSSITAAYPIISWRVFLSHENCPKDITLVVSCTNIENETDVAPISKSFTFDANGTEVTTELTSLEDRAMYRCYGIVKTNTSMASNPSDTIDVSTILTDKITILKINTEARTIFIKWERLLPERKLNYSVHITEMEAGHFLPDCGKSKNTSKSASTKNNYYYFTAALPDYNYSVVIKTIIRNNPINSDVNFITTSAAAPGTPRNVFLQDPSADHGSSSISKKLFWDMPCNPNGRIQRYDIKLTGVYTPDQSHKPSKKLKYTLTKSDEEHFNQVLDGLTASTNYTLSIKAVGENGDAGLGYETSFTTRDAIPDPPEVNIPSQSSSYLDISWKLPDDVLYGNITNFHIYIIPLKPKYGRYPINCPAQDPLYHKLNGTSRSFSFTKAHGHWIYNIFVSASTSIGTGRNGTLQATTNTSAPEMTRNFDLSVPEIEGGSSNVKKFISWEIPCFPNGRINSYRVNVNGYYTVDGSHTYSGTPEFNVSTYQERYNVTLENLNASTKYILNITAIGNGEGTPVNGTFLTKDAIPDAPPIENRFDFFNSGDTINWKAPTRAGKITHYEIKVAPISPLYFIPQDCTKNRNIPLHLNVSESKYAVPYVLPYYKYEVEVAAATRRGLGNFSKMFFNTAVGVPDKIRFLGKTITNVTQEEYDASAIIKFKQPCFTNGTLKNITLQYKGTGASEIFHVDIDFLDRTDLEYRLALKPEVTYEIGINAENEEFRSDTYAFSITAPSGVPLMDPQYPVEISRIGLTGADVTLRKEQFDNSNGEIRYISLILSEIALNSGGKFGAWDGTTWPVVFNETEYEVTEDFWYPFKDKDMVTFSIGSASPGCRKSLKYCNEPLKEDKEYFLIVRMLNKGFYKNSPAIFFRTARSWTGFILGLIFGLLIAGILAIITFFLWRNGQLQYIINRFPRKTHTKPESTTRIPCKKFLQYCKNMECNPQKYQEQYKLLSEEAKEITADKTISIATLPENRRKNRYTNIAPYDETRVELRIDEDDEIGSDYINASFIKGYSGFVEYIATQGPMVTTTRDFWKMVLQENVTLIVMVSQFVENDKQKCHRYFPKNHDSMTISDDMEVRCSTELHFGTYCVRNLQIRKDDVQASVTHMQFLDWPDFGVPNGTDIVLQFCHQLRERIMVEGGLMIVHCSAGVGRTGTLIATDILMQTANAGKDIDVYNTVLELRKQRVLMVQTDKQYVFIHSMLKDHLDRPPSPDLVENSEPVYENMEIINDTKNGGNCMIKNEDESKF